MQRSDEDAISDDIEEEVIILRQNGTLMYFELLSIYHILF